jgi:hypothetical protein
MNEGEQHASPTQGVAILIAIAMLVLAPISALGAVFLEQLEFRLLCIFFVALILSLYFVGKELIPEFVAALVFVAFVGLLVVSCYRLWSMYGRTLALLIKAPAGASGATAAIALIGYSLFKLKKKALKVYALLELGFALASCYVAFVRANQGTLDTANVSAIVGAAYLVVRGLGNWDDAKNKK